jgi:hypothetical protein
LQTAAQKLDDVQIAIEVMGFTRMDPHEPPVSDERSIPADLEGDSRELRRPMGGCENASARAAFPPPMLADGL